MRKPLTRQNSTRDKRRYSAYQNRIFFYLVTLCHRPAAAVGCAVQRGVLPADRHAQRCPAGLGAGECRDADGNCAEQPARLLQRGRQRGQLPDPVPKKLCRRTASTPLCAICRPPCGGNLVDKYVEGYTYINLRSGWILSNNGMYRLADAANRDGRPPAERMGGQHAAMMWVNRTDQPTPRWQTPLNTVDLTGELLVLRSNAPTARAAMRC